jgi:hypothetical protein
MVPRIDVSRVLDFPLPSEALERLLGGLSAGVYFYNTPLSDSQ